MVHTIDYLIIAIFLLAPILISLWFSKRQKSTKVYFTANASVPAWAIGLSILATLISSITFLAYPGEGYASNWILLVQGLMVPVTLLFFIGFVVPLYRDVIHLTAYEYFEQRFGFFARLYTSLGFFLAHFSKMGTVFYLVALAYSKMTGIDTLSLIWITGFIVVFIALIGGMEAIIWMDVVQGILLIVGGIVSLGLVLFTTPGGISEIWHVAWENGKVGFGPFNFDFVHLTFWVMAINGIFYAIQKYGTDQTMVQRYLCAKSDKDTIKASWIGVLLSSVVWSLFMFIGTALFAYYHLKPGSLPANIKADEVFPHFIMNELPVGFVGLLLASLLAAAISSLDSDLNCLSAICVGDYYKRFKKNSTERQNMFVGRLVVVLAGLASVLVAIYYVKIGGEKGALKTVFSLYAIFSGGIAGMFLLGLFCKRANKQGIYIGIVACILFTAYAVLSSTKIDIGGEKRPILDLGRFNYPHHYLMLGVYSHIVLFTVGYVASLFFKKPENITHLTYYGWKNKKQSLE
ncbi:MAG: sodium:solute symporter [Thermoguttaceae bacterium]|jgi:SSS family solute:Na+ symporter